MEALDVKVQFQIANGIFLLMIWKSKNPLVLGDSHQVLLEIQDFLYSIINHVCSIVFRGKWHGDVAIRIIEMKNMEDEAALEAFRSDVATFTKTRHENVVLFMGSSQQLTKIDRKLAIVTSLCKGTI